MLPLYFILVQKFNITNTNWAKCLGNEITQNGLKGINWTEDERS